MSYNIIKTDGTPLAVVADGQTKQDATSLVLIGKNYAGYGTFLNENFIKLLENFSSATEPLYPLVGQLWWKKDTRILKVYDQFGTWKTISGAQSQSDAPTNAIAGDLWFDTVNQQLKTYSGASWIVIGPSFTATTGTSGAIADTVIASDLLPHVVVKFFVQNQLIAILSKDETFTPGTTIPGFSTIRPGFNLARDRIPALVYYDNANNASYLGGVLANRYVLKTAPTLEAKLVIQNVDGIEIQETGGTVSYFEMNQSGSNINFIGKQRGQGFVFKMIPDSGGLQINALTIDRVTGLVSVSAPTPSAGSALLIATKGYVDAADVVLSGQITSAVNAINETIGTLTANTTVVYGNVRVLQSTLGIGGPPGANVTAWNQLTTGSGQTIAGNIMSLWSNVAAIHANVLSNTGTAPAGTASMYSNVKLLQDEVSSIGTRALLRNGDSTWTGVQRPDANNTYDIGTAGFRFKDFYANTANLWSVVHGGITTAPGVGDIGQPELRFGTAYLTVANVHSVTKGGTVATGDIGQASNRFGTTYATTANVHNITKGGTNGTGDIGASGQTFGVGYINQVRLKVASGVALANDGTNSVGDIGADGARFNTLFADIADVNSLKVNGTSLSTVVTTVAGTTNRVTVTGTGSGPYSGAITLNLPQDIHTAASPTFTGLTVSSITKGGTNGTGDIGASGQTFGTVWATTFSGVSTTAKYADLAERFLPDTEYAPGTVVRIGGIAEITQEDQDSSEDVFGVVSTDPAYKMNSELENGLYVALAGRVPVRVIGAVKKGDRLVSAGNGCARVAQRSECTAFNIIGRALVDKDSAEEGLVEAVVIAR